MALVLENVSGVIALLDLDMPHLLILMPVRADNSVIEAHVFVEVVLFRDILKVLENLRCARVAIRSSLLVSPLWSEMPCSGWIRGRA